MELKTLNLLPCFLLLLASCNATLSIDKPLSEVSSTLKTTEPSVDPVLIDEPLHEEDWTLEMKVKDVIQRRCFSCHHISSSFLFPGGGVVLNKPGQIQKYRQRIYVRTVLREDMPLDKDAMLEREREWVKQWYEAENTDVDD